MNAHDTDDSGTYQRLRPIKGLGGPYGLDYLWTQARLDRMDSLVVDAMRRTWVLLEIDDAAIERAVQRLRVLQKSRRLTEIERDGYWVRQPAGSLEPGESQSHFALQALWEEGWE